jgi:mRNA interferase MazF
MKRGEIWRINLDPTIGAEIKKSRFCVIVNHNAIGILPLKIIVPITEWKDKFAKAPWLIRLEATEINGLTKESAADTFQVRSVSVERFVEKIGELSKEDMGNIKRGLILSLDIGD